MLAVVFFLFSDVDGRITESNTSFICANLPIVVKLKLGSPPERLKAAAMMPAAIVVANTRCRFAVMNAVDRLVLIQDIDSTMLVIAVFWQSPSNIKRAIAVAFGKSKRIVFLIPLMLERHRFAKQMRGFLHEWSYISELNSAISSIAEQRGR